MADRPRRTPAAVRVSRILVPTDFSGGAEAALRWARRLADALRARLIVLHVVDLTALALAADPAGGAMAAAAVGVFDRVRDDARAQMRALAARVRPTRTLVEEGPPRATILEVAGRERADLIVMGTHGRTGLARVLFGSVAEHVVRTSPVPVLTVRAPAARRGAGRRRAR
jgi:nucleotide-binding universal stress UspA family protein